MAVSIIICCYNSAKRLPETLKHIVNQHVAPDFLWEVVLVDNNSSDKTKEIAAEEWSKYNTSCSFRIISEPTPGVGWARRKGVLEARYDYVLFCDDDNWLHENYVSNAYKYITADANTVAIGGRGEPVFETPEPSWFKNVYSSYALGPQSVPGTLYSAGLIVNKKVLLNLYNIGFESLLVGRTGTSLSSGEDFEYMYLVQIIGYKIDYKDDLVFKHFIPKEKLTLTYVDKLFKGFGDSYPVLACYSFLFNNSTLPPQKQWLKLMSEQLYKTPLIFLFGKSRPRKAHLLMNIASIKSFWKLKDQYIQGHKTIQNWKERYREAYNKRLEATEQLR